MSISLGELAVQFGCELVGDPSAAISRVATLQNADSETLSFFANKAYLEQLRHTSAAAVIGNACFVHGIMTTGLIVATGGDRMEVERTVAALRPYAAMLVVSTSAASESEPWSGSPATSSSSSARSF